MRSNIYTISKPALSIAILCAACVSTNTLAQDAADDWQFSATLYGWFPDIGGQTSFPLGSGRAIDVDISTILDHLEMTAQGTFEVHKGNWGALADLVYLDVGATKSRTRNLELGGQPLPAAVTAATDFNLESLFVTFGGTYRLVESQGFVSDFLFGARLASLEQTIEWEFAGNLGSVAVPATGAREVSADQWDAIIGAKGQWAFGADHKWVVPFYIDLGAGDSDLTWQATLGLAYAFEWGDLGAAWRYLDYDIQTGNPIADINFNGPALGATIRW